MDFEDMKNAFVVFAADVLFDERTPSPVAIIMKEKMNEVFEGEPELRAEITRKVGERGANKVMGELAPEEGDSPQTTVLKEVLRGMVTEVAGLG